MSKLVKCMVCGKELNSLKELQNHVSDHNIYLKEYYDKYLKNDKNEGICKNYGIIDICKHKTIFCSFEKGYKKYCSSICYAQNNKIGVSGSEYKKIFIHPNKGKNYEEIMGIEKTILVKKKLSIIGKTLVGPKNPFYNHHEHREIYDILANKKRGKKYAEIYGIEKAKEIILKQTKPQKKPWLDISKQFYTKKFYNKSFREEILNDQENLCAICKTFLYSKRRQFHHINFIKSDDRRENIICLCPSCHGKTKNRLTYENTMEFLTNRNRIIIIESRERLKLNRNKKIKN